MNRLRFRRLQVAVGRENPSYPTQARARTHVGRAFVGELGLWLWLVVVALDESGVVVPALRTWSFPCGPGCARVQGGGGVAGRGREVGTGESQAEGMVYEGSHWQRGSFLQQCCPLVGPPTGLWQA